MGAPQLQLLVRPEEFFRERLSVAAANQKVDIDHDVEFYLVQLLCEFITPTKIETLAGELDALDTPLAMMLKQAVEAPPTQRVRIFKYLGDTSLYFAGFFQDYFTRKTFDIGYYISLGASAYDTVSHLINDQHGDATFTGVYRRMATRFNVLVDLVAEVSEGGAERPVDLLAVYDRWTKSQSNRLFKVLSRAGIAPMPASKLRQ